MSNLATMSMQTPWEWRESSSSTRLASSLLEELVAFSGDVAGVLTTPKSSSNSSTLSDVSQTRTEQTSARDVTEWIACGIASVTKFRTQRVILSNLPRG